jgi:hypothetical protein
MESRLAKRIKGKDGLHIGVTPPLDLEAGVGQTLEQARRAESMTMPPSQRPQDSDKLIRGVVFPAPTQKISVRPGLSRHRAQQVVEKIEVIRSGRQDQLAAGCQCVGHEAAKLTLVGEVFDYFGTEEQIIGAIELSG